MPYPNWRSLQAYRPQPVEQPVAPAGQVVGQTNPLGPEFGPAAGRVVGRNGRDPVQVQARLDQMLRSGQIRPDRIFGEDGRVRPEIWQQIDSIAPYNELPPPDLALTGSRVPDRLLGGSADQTGYPYGDAYGSQGYTYLNPEEIQNDQWTRTFSALRANEQVQRSGTYRDYATGMDRVTAERADQLLGRFGNANVAEAQYRQQVAQNQAQAANSNQGVQQATLQRNQVGQDARITGGGYNPTGEQQGAIQMADQAVNQAQMAYNRARGLAGQVQKPIGLDELARGMTPEMFGQYAQAVGQGYTPEEMQQVQANPAQFAKDPRYAPALAYRRVNIARGGL